MSLNVSLPSICTRNEWFLIARLLFSCWIRVMGTVLNTNELKRMIRVAQPPDSWLCRIQREIRQEQDRDSTLDEDFVAPALCHMPIEVVSVRVWAPALAENATRSRVMDRAGRESESEWRNLGEAEVKPSGTVQVSVRGRDEKMSRQNRNECDQIFRTEARTVSIFWERMICLWNSELGRLPFS